MDSNTSLLEAIRYFTDFENCRRFVMELRWADGSVKCPKCGATKVTWLANRRVWKCYAKHVSPTFSLKTGTIFEDSPIGLEKWLPAAWMLINCKNRVSSYELHRALRVTQKSAWFMLHRIRLAMQSRAFEKLGEEVEVDETFIGGKTRNMHKRKREEKITGTGGKDKTIVIGMVERGGEVRAFVVNDRRKRIIHQRVREHIEAGSAIFSDELKSYDGLEN